MEYRELSIPGAWEITPKQFGDPRGVFLEWFKDAPFAQATGHSLDLQQANMSVSAAGVLRGIHFADVPPGQAKYVTCPKGAVLDVVVDIRVGSPTFGQWDSVLLDDTDQESGQQVASQLLATLDKPMFVDNQLISVTGSVGLAWSGVFASAEWATGHTHIAWGWPLVAALLFIAIGPALVAYRCWGIGVQRAGPAVAGFFSNLTPLFAALLSAAFLGEAPSGYHAVAFALIVGGIVVSSRR